jgi:hypothetical protein
VRIVKHRVMTTHSVQLVHIGAILCVAIITAAGLAHLMALPNKIGMTRDHYLIAQQIYRGWAFLGIAEIAALALTVTLAWLYREGGARFSLSLAAAVCIVIGLVIFFWFTFPANKATANWTTLPQDWEALRARWEYSHAAGAVLESVALVSLVIAAFSNHSPK